MHRALPEPFNASELVAFVARQLTKAAVPEDAAPMAAYMKTDMPFYGVRKPGRVPIIRQAIMRFKPPGIEAWETGAHALWCRPHREEKYIALEWSMYFKNIWLRPPPKGTANAEAVAAVLALVETVAREGAWWDLVDLAVGTLLSPLFKQHRNAVHPTIEQWADDPQMWLRRTAIISQLKHKAETDAELLFDLCRRRAHEREFFIRKAIGWALRTYSYTDPEAVRGFLRAERERLSGLSFREGAKVLKRQGLMA